MKIASALGRLIRRQPPPGAVQVHSLWMRLDQSEGIQNGMAQGSYEIEQTGWARECLAPGATCVDVGASFGNYTALAASIVGENGRVFAFEPSPVAGQVIEHLVRDNHLKNVTLTRAAVGEAPGSIEINMPKDRALHSPSIFAPGPGFTPLRVPMVSLDSFLPLGGTRPISLVKIDVEGYEPNVVRGMKMLAKTGRIKNLLCEFNSGWLRQNNTTPEQLLDLVVSLGFRIHKKTALNQLVAQNDETFDLQDIWFKGEA